MDATRASTHLSEVSQIRDIYHIWNLIIHSIVATKNQKQHKRTDLHNFEELKEKEIWVGREGRGYTGGRCGVVIISMRNINNIVNYRT